MKLSKLRVIILALFLACLAGVAGIYVFRAPIKGVINGIRAERMFAKAEEAFAAERWTDAARMGTAAHHLDPDNPRIDLLVARALLKQRNGAAVAWWNMVIDEPNLPVGELRELTTALLAARQLEQALPFLSRLVELDGGNPETHKLWLQSLQLQHRYRKVQSLASQFAQQGSADWCLHRAYVQMQQSAAQGDDLNPVIEHLKKLLQAGGPLALNASREILRLQGIDAGTVRLAARYLSENSGNLLDRLYAMGTAVRLGDQPRDSLDALLNEVLAEPEAGQLEQVLLWSTLMNEEDWFLDNVDWSSYYQNQGSPDAYLRLLYTQQRFDQLLQLTESTASEAGTSMAAFLYFRSLVLRERGDEDGAEAALGLAVETVDPSSYPVLERYLAGDGNWNLLSQLYAKALIDNPDDPVYLAKALGASYYSGQQDELAPFLDRLDLTDFEDKPDIQGFILYCRLLETGFDAEAHKDLEFLMAEYPEVFDFRLILAVSYAMQGRATLGQQLIEGMPEIPENAPRYLRVAAVIMGLPAEELLLSGEREELLPRERFLISLQTR